MERTQGARNITVSVIDGPVWLGHPAFSDQHFREITNVSPATCRNLENAACAHGTLVTGMLAARRGSGPPAICPGCAFILRPIFAENTIGAHSMPVSTQANLGAAITDSVFAGANVINVSAAPHPSSLGERELMEALDHAAQRGVLVVAAAGNHATVGGSAITRHSWVIPVVSCNAQGIPTAESNLGHSIGRRGLAAPGENVISLGTEGKLRAFGGTSAAAPFVTGAIALLWSEFPHATAAQIKLALTQPRISRPRTVAPPLLNAWAAYLRMSSN
jgi:subtilisin family serine protease